MTAALAGSFGREDTYTPLSRKLHWLTVALVTMMIPVGVVMTRLDPTPLQNFLFTLHESLGLVLWPIVLGRVVNRMRNTPPPLPEDLHPLIALAAYVVQMFLYACLLIMPILGIIGVYTFGASVKFLWLVELPIPIAKHEALSKLVLLVHSWLAVLMAVAILGHVAIALYHHFVRRDRVLLRMLGR